MSALNFTIPLYVIDNTKVKSAPFQRGGVVIQNIFYESQTHRLKITTVPFWKKGKMHRLSALDNQGKLRGLEHKTAGVTKDLSILLPKTEFLFLEVNLDCVAALKLAFEQH